MHLNRTLSVGLFALVLWNCNSSTQPDVATNPDPKVVGSINALTKIAATKAGYVLMDPTVPTESELPFKADALKALKDAGLCQGFIDLFEEISTQQQSLESGTITPRLQQVVTCFEDKANQITDSTTLKNNFMSIVDECFCNGTGTLFGNFNVKLAKYGPPSLGMSYDRPVITGTPYNAPAVTGTPYSAPVSPASETYSAPNL